MKKNKKLIVLIGIVLINLSLFSQENLQDSSKIINDTTKFHLFDNMKLMIGAGMTTGSALENWERYFEKGPVFNIGLEIPFNLKNTFSFQISYHTWLSKSKKVKNFYNNNLNDYYWYFVKTFGDNYLNGSVSTIFKWCFFRSSSIRLTLDAGLFFLGMSRRYFGEDLGLSIYYKLNNKSSISLNQKLLVSFIWIPPYTIYEWSRVEVFPNQLLLNYYYKL